MADETLTRPGRDIGRTNNLGSRLIGLFHEALSQRQQFEIELLKDERQFKGVYESDELKRFKERDNCDKTFVRITASKCKTLDARIMDLVRGTGKKNWSIRPDEDPDVVEVEGTADEPDDPQAAQQQKAMLDSARKIAAAAENMDKEIWGQFQHAQLSDLQNMVCHSGHKYGTGILKGPLVTSRKVKQWRRVRSGSPGEDDGDAGPASQATPSQADFTWQVIDHDEDTPSWEFVPIWDYFPEMDGWDLNNTEYAFQRHCFHKSDLLGLASKPGGFWDAENIRRHVAAHPDGDATVMTFEVELDAIGRYTSTRGLMRRRKYEVLEYWGPVSVEELAEMGKELPEDLAGQVEAHVWFFRSNGVILGADINPTAKKERPYSFYTPFREEGHLFGESLPSIMRDLQRLLNSATRMMSDNAASAVGPQVELDVSRVPTAKNLTAMPPFRIWAVEPDPYGNNQRAINFSDFPNHTQMYLMMLQWIGAKIDETVAIPAYTSGGNPGSGAGRTSSGLSMLMGAAGLMLKNQLYAWDAFMGRTVMLAYDWNMQFNLRDDIKGNYRVHVVGSLSMALKEMRAEQLKQFRLSTNNPNDNKWIKRRELLWVEAEENDIDPSRFIKTKLELMQETEDAQKEAAAAANDPLKKEMLALSMREKVAGIVDKLADAAMKNAKAGDSLDEMVQAEMAELDALVQHMDASAVPAPGAQPAPQQQGGPSRSQPPAPSTTTAPAAVGPTPPAMAPGSAQGGHVDNVKYLRDLLADSLQSHEYR